MLDDVVVRRSRAGPSDLRCDGRLHVGAFGLSAE